MAAKFGELEDVLQTFGRPISGRPHSLDPWRVLMHPYGKGFPVDSKDTKAMLQCQYHFWHVSATEGLDDVADLNTALAAVDAFARLQNKRWSCVGAACVKDGEIVFLSHGGDGGLYAVIQVD